MVNRDMYHFYFNKNLLWEIIPALSDRIETVGKNRFLPLWWIFLLHMNNFGKNLLWEQADRGCAAGDVFVGGEGAFGQKSL